MTTRLLLYNHALQMVGERPLANPSENREPRRMLDSVWDRGGVKYVLEQGQWKFAMRAAKLEYSPSVTPAFGYQRAFEKPSDLIRIAALCSDEYFNCPLLRVAEETGFWFADLDEIYIRYVSNDAEFGGDLSLWPETFASYAASYFASQIVYALTHSDEKTDKIKKEMGKLLVDARSKDAMAGPTVFPPKGSWSSSRGSSYGDGGSRGSLIG